MKRKLPKGVLTVACNQAVSEGAVLLRNILLARVLGPEQMGLAVTLAIALRCLEMFSYLAADRLLVQARDGNRRTLQGSAQGLEALRGLLSGIVLAAGAYPLAFAFGQAQAAWAFAMLATVPLVRGFVHLDYRRLQRRLCFGPTFKVEALSGLIGLAATWPMLRLVADFSALLWISLVQAIAFVLISHLVARRAYRIRFERHDMRRLLRFGWPILVNGLIMFGVFQGDRLIVALSVSLEDLGRYSVALQLGLLPTLVAARAGLSLGLPILARVQASRAAFQVRYDRTLSLCAGGGLIFVAAYLLLGNTAVALLFGPDFQMPAAVVGWIGCAMGLRLVRVAPGTATLALGDSRSLMHANVFRLGGVAGAAAAGAAGLGLTWITAAACVGELAALIAASALLRRRHDIRIAPPRWVAAVAAAALACGWLYARPPMPGLTTTVAAAAAFALGVILWHAARRYRWGAPSVAPHELPARPHHTARGP